MTKAKNVRINIIENQSPNLFGRLFDKSFPELSRNLPSLKEVLFIAAHTPKTTGTNRSASKFVARIELRRIYPRIAATVTMLYNLLRERLTESRFSSVLGSGIMATLFKAFMQAILAQKYLKFKQVLGSALKVLQTLLSLMLFCGSFDSCAVTNIGIATNNKSNISFALDEYLYPSRNELYALIDSYEKKHKIPRKLLQSIAAVESNFNQFAISAAGKSFIAKSKEDATKIVRYYLEQNVRNIDIGLMQLNWHFHGKNFTDISSMLELENNISYAALMLKNLYSKHGSWQEAVKHYHSAKPQYNTKYSRKVLISWLNKERGSK